MAELTEKQEKYCQSYLICGNQSTAYRLAYDAESMNQNSVGVEACKMHADPRISLRIKELQKEAYERNKIEIDEIIQTLAGMVRFDIADLYDENGVLKNIQQIPVHARQMISELLVDEIKMQDTVIGHSRKIKTINKLDAIEKLMKHLGGYEKDNKQKKISVDLSGLTTEGATLTSTTGTWSGTGISYTYQWYRGATLISGATASTYVLTLADSQASMTCQVTATNTAGSNVEPSNAINAGNYAPTNSVAPVVSGTTGLGDLLSCTTGTWAGTSITYTYQWKRGGVDIVGETASTHTIVALDQGENITCLVTATNTAGANSQVSNTVAVPSAGIAFICCVNFC